MRKHDLKLALRMTGVAYAKLEEDLEAALLRERSLRGHIAEQATHIRVLKEQVNSLSDRVQRS